MGESSVSLSPDELCLARLLRYLDSHAANKWSVLAGRLLYDLRTCTFDEELICCADILVVS